MAEESPAFSATEPGIIRTLAGRCDEELLDVQLLYASLYFAGAGSPSSRSALS